MCPSQNFVLTLWMVRLGPGTALSLSTYEILALATSRAPFEYSARAPMALWRRRDVRAGMAGSAFD